MTSLKKVTLPSNVKFKTPFDVTIEYTTDGPTNIVVTPLSHVVASPAAVAVSVEQSGKTVSMTLTDAESKKEGRIVLLQFSLGPSTFTAGTTAAP